MGRPSKKATTKKTATRKSVRKATSKKATRKSPARKTRRNNSLATAQKAHKISIKKVEVAQKLLINAEAAFAKTGARVAALEAKAAAKAAKA